MTASPWPALQGDHDDLGLYNEQEETGEQRDAHLVKLTQWFETMAKSSDMTQIGTTLMPV